MTALCILFFVLNRSSSLSNNDFHLRIGEKMSVWAEKPPLLEDILANVSLYWLTGCFPTSIWIYREVRVTYHMSITIGKRKDSSTITSLSAMKTSPGIIR